MNLSKSRIKKCNIGIHLYAQAKYLKRLDGSNVLIQGKQCQYCGKKLKNNKTILK